jgi:hypothetical protein
MNADSNLTKIKSNYDLGLQLQPLLLNRETR